MFRLSCKLLLRFFLILLGVSLISFLLMYLAPGDPAKNMLASQGIPFTKELLEAKRLEFGFQDPFWVQYGRWLLGVFHGNLGITYHSRSSVAKELAFYCPNTLFLAGFTLFLTLLISIPLSFISVFYKKSLISKVISFATALANTISNFVLGIGLMVVFSLYLHLFPIQSTIDLKGVVLPALTLAVTMSSRYIPQLQEGVTGILESDAVLGAMGRGLRRGQILGTTIFPQLFPLLLTLITLSLTSLLGGVAVIEYLFSWPGIGKMLITAVHNRDFPLIQGSVLVITTSVLLVNTVAEFIQLIINPKRNRKEGSNHVI